MLYALITRTAEANNARQTGNRCAKQNKGEQEEEDVQAADMTHIGAARYEFAMMLLGLLAHGGASG